MLNEPMLEHLYAMRLHGMAEAFRRQPLEFNLRRCEDSWQREPETAPGAARPNLGQADPAPAARLPSRGAERGDDGAERSRDPREPLAGGPIEEAC